jgi:opacity protein-like surface antigen
MTSLVRKTTYAFALAILLAATPAFAADVDGKWSGTISVAGVGDVPVAFEFKADGATLTGSTLSPDCMSVNIKDGKIDGDKVTFGVTLDFGGMALDIAYSGVVTPTEMKMTADVAGMALEFVVKKEK